MSMGVDVISSIPLVTKSSNVLQKAELLFAKLAKKIGFIGVYFGRIFGRKFRPMWPNIRFRPKLDFSLSVVH